MKTLILTAALVVFTTFSFAQLPKPEVNDTLKPMNADIEVAILQNADDQVNILMAKEPGKLVKIKVYEDNKLLYVRRVKKAGTANIKYDISAFPDGEYVFQVEKDKKVVFSAKVRKGPAALADN